MSVSWTVGEFLAERELAFHAKSAKKFYDELSVLLDGLPTYQHENMGMAKGVSEVESCFFRGQACADWGLHSSLYRLLEGGGKFFEGQRMVDRNERVIAATEKSILDLARQNGIGRRLTALETLTVLQHHQVPTRLIDVSTDWKVALYFACEELDSKGGRLFLISTSPHRWVRDFPKAVDPGRNLVWWDSKNKLKRWKTSVWPVLLPFSDVRMISQKGFFLVGGLTSSQGEHHYYRKVQYPGAPNESVHNNDMRRISSIAVEFPNYGSKANHRKRLNDFIDVRLGRSVKPRKSKWTAAALTIRVPHQFKGQIRQLLHDDEIFKDSVYPPITEVRRLLRYAASN